MGRRLGFWRRFVVCVIRPTMIVFTRQHWSGTDHLPASGAAILAVNHVSPADPLTMSHFVYDAGRWPHFLAKASVFKVMFLGSVLRTVGQIPVSRGTVDAAKSLSVAEEALAAGEVVVIYPEGTVTKQPEYWPMRGKTGVARLALTTGAPVIPVVQWGPQTIFDRHANKFRWKRRYDITVLAGPPVDLEKFRGLPLTPEMLQDVADEIMYAIRDLLEEIRGEKAPELFNPGRGKS